MAAGAVSLRKSHDIVISSFCNIVKGQANNLDSLEAILRKEKNVLSLIFINMYKDLPNSGYIELVFLVNL